MNENLAYFGSNQVLLLYKNKCYYVGLDTFDKNKIETLNFVNSVRAESMRQGLFARYTAKIESDWPTPFKEELAKKILPTAEAYRPFLQDGALYLVTGNTSDTLERLPHEVENSVAWIGDWMEKGNSGPYLRFKNP